MMTVYSLSWSVKFRISLWVSHQRCCCFDPASHSKVRKLKGQNIILFVFVSGSYQKKETKLNKRRHRIVIHQFFARYVGIRDLRMVVKSKEQKNSG